NSASEPSARNSDRAASALVLLRPAIATVAPAEASPLAMPRPMPPLPPVTNATRFCRSNIVITISRSMRHSVLAFRCSELVLIQRNSDLAGERDRRSRKQAERQREQHGSSRLMSRADIG